MFNEKSNGDSSSKLKVPNYSSSLGPPNININSTVNSIRQQHRGSVSFTPERQFLIAVERSDISTVRTFLDNAGTLNFNVNCRDSLGRNAILIAIDNEHIELLQVLLQYEQLDLSDALLHAIDEEHLEAVELIIVAQSTRAIVKPERDTVPTPISSFTPDITPIILAAHKDNYEIIKLLLDRGDRIPKPHDMRCNCSVCVQAQKVDSLHHSLSRINAYKALASPCLIALSSKDPILTAFELSWELRRLGQLENEFTSVFEQLSLQCEEFATALLEQTRQSFELAVLLNHNTNASTSNFNAGSLAANNDGIFGAHPLTRLKLAIKYNQKSFVANAHCQQLLASLWYEGLPGFRRKPFVYKLGIIGALGAMFPVLCLFYLVCPQSRVAQLMRKPFIKFICHSSSYIMFLVLLILAALRIEYSNSEDAESRHLPPTAIECLLMVYIAGFIWQEVKELWGAGVKTYIMDMWNLLDFATNALYVATISLRAVAYYKFNYTENVVLETRTKWDSYDPILISECLFAAANIFSTLKLVYIFTMNPQLGPLQISLGRMLTDILKFFCVYMLVLIAFACGLNQLLWFYSKKRKEICAKDHYKFFQPTEEAPSNDLHNYCATRGKYFTNLFEIVQSLYWSTYGLIDLTNLNIEYPHEFTEFVGKLMFGAYSYITLVVLLNMLIAMMNTSYQIIQEKADIEWKFARSKLWLSYFEDGHTLPAPFNIIISPKTVFYLTRWLHFNWFCKSKGRKSRWQSIKKIVSKVNEMELRYQQVMENLVVRYLMSRQKKEDKEEVTEDDINDIKGDISAFRYELLDILQNNGMEIPKLTQEESGSRTKSKSRGSKKSLYRYGRQLSSATMEKSPPPFCDPMNSSNSERKFPMATSLTPNSSSIPFGTNESSDPFSVNVNKPNSLRSTETISSDKNDCTQLNSSANPPPLLNRLRMKPRKSFSLDDQPTVSFDLNPQIIENYHSSLREKKDLQERFSQTKSVLKSAFTRNFKMGSSSSGGGGGGSVKVKKEMLDETGDNYSNVLPTTTISTTTSNISEQPSFEFQSATINSTLKKINGSNMKNRTTSAGYDELKTTNLSSTSFYDLTRDNRIRPSKRSDLV